MEIARQELIVHAREAASRVLSELSGEPGPGCAPVVPGAAEPHRAPHNPNPCPPGADRQLSEQKALDAQKREQFQRLKEQFEKEQEVGVPGPGV